jgi:hypothetical protein
MNPVGKQPELTGTDEIIVKVRSGDVLRHNKWFLSGFGKIASILLCIIGVRRVIYNFSLHVV